MVYDHSLDRSSSVRSDFPFLHLVAETETSRSAGHDFRRRQVYSPAGIRAPLFDGAFPRCDNLGGGVDGSYAGGIPPGVHPSPMNAGYRLRQERSRGSSSTTGKPRHCDGTSSKENLRRASTFRTSSDLSGDHG